ncbi:MAG: hypothetical protein IGS48_01885 [Oscillatoriales cyanobacterium C42_A2020_001]|nr:hypothetical protein [Leptolyngbyaceae cyanobacterium C42_A2020_001]
MNLAKFSLIICPAVLMMSSTTVVVSAQALEAATSAQTRVESEQASSHDLLEANSSGLVSDPQVPRGCMCSHCLQSPERLQGQFPKF